MNTEPRNSFEISFVIKIRKPQLDIGISTRNLVKILGTRRCDELREWAYTQYTYRWFKDSI